MSNALGTIMPIKRIIDAAHKVGAIVVVDGAQAIPHARVDVQALGADFYAFSAHKLYGPTGIGVLYGREALLDSMPPWQGGGDMIRSVTFAKSTYNDLPWKFEAGTPNMSGAVGLAAAMDYVDQPRHRRHRCSRARPARACDRRVVEDRRHPHRWNGCA